MNGAVAGSFHVPDQCISGFCKPSFHDRKWSTSRQEHIEVRRGVTGNVVLIADSRVVHVEQVNSGYSWCSQIAFEPDIIRTKDIHRTCIFIDVVVEGGTNRCQSIAHGHIKSKAVILHRIARVAFTDARQSTIAAVKEEVSRSSIDGKGVVAGHAHSNQ